MLATELRAEMAAEAAFQQAQQLLTAEQFKEADVQVIEYLSRLLRLLSAKLRLISSQQCSPHMHASCMTRLLLYFAWTSYRG
eukprot:COSAG05_NODE_723_length_7727_cov_19.327871_11_plen_82_part_00